MKKITRKLFKKTFVEDEDGATAVEYGLLVALIAVAIVLIVAVLGRNLGSTFDTAQQQIGPAAPIAPS